MIKTKLEIRVKGEVEGQVKVLPVGLPVTFLKDNPSRCLVHGDRAEPYRVRVTSAFKSPSLNKLEKASDDGICPSVGGKRVEPDGWDENGSPSWLLALGMI